MAHLGSQELSRATIAMVLYSTSITIVAFAVMEILTSAWDVSKMGLGVAEIIMSCSNAILYTMKCVAVKPRTLALGCPKYQLKASLNIFRFGFRVYHTNRSNADTPGWATLIYEGRSHIYPTGIPQLQAYFRTILFDQDYVTHGRLSSSEDRFFEFAKVFACAVFNPWYPPCSEMAKWKKYTTLHSEAPLQFDIFLGDPGSEGALTWPSNAGVTTIAEACSDLNIRPFVSTLLHKTKNRKFFVTSRGYMGLGSPRVEVGDVICVFPGHNVPVTVRKINDHYTYQGECFVLGIMDGEVMENLDKGTVYLKELVIH